MSPGATRKESSPISVPVRSLRDWMHTDRVSRSWVSRRAVSVTDHPASASATAVARPMPVHLRGVHEMYTSMHVHTMGAQDWPEDAPVMMAILAWDIEE